MLLSTRRSADRATSLAAPLQISTAVRRVRYRERSSRSNSPRVAGLAPTAARCSLVIDASQLVALINSPIAAPSGRWSRATIEAFLDGRAGGTAVRIFGARDEAAFATGRCGLVGFADLRAVLRAGCAAAFALLGLRDLDMI